MSGASYRKISKISTSTTDPKTGDETEEINEIVNNDEDFEEDEGFRERCTTVTYRVSKF